MNFTSGGTEQETLDLDQQKEIRKREWEEARQREAKMPEYKKPENYDPRSLYERLQEQKEKKQEEFDEKMKFKNQIQYLDTDDVNFLEEKAREEEEKEATKWEEELEAVREYRQQVLRKEEAKAQAFNLDPTSGASAGKGTTSALAAAPGRRKEREALSALVKPKRADIASLVAPSAQKRSSVESDRWSTDAQKRARLESDAADSSSREDEDLSDREPSLGTSILAAYGSDSDDEP